MADITKRGIDCEDDCGGKRGKRGHDGAQGPAGPAGAQGFPGPNTPTSLGFFGTGVDGSLNYDSIATILGVVPVGGVYTLTSDIFPSNLTVESGITIVTAGYRIYVAGTLTILGTGKISNDGSPGGDASLSAGGTGGAGAPGANLAAGAAGGNAVVAGGGPGGVGTNITNYPLRSTGNGGAGGATAFSGGAGGNGINQAGFGTYIISTMADGTNTGGGPGGGAGAADPGGFGGGGGGGGGVMVISARTIIAPDNSITARGARGGNANGSLGLAAGGGGGAGGTVLLLTNGDTPSIDVSGGPPGASEGGGLAQAGTSGTAIFLGQTISPPPPPQPFPLPAAVVRVDPIGSTFVLGPQSGQFQSLTLNADGTCTITLVPIAGLTSADQIFPVGSVSSIPIGIIGPAGPGGALEASAFFQGGQGHIFIKIIRFENGSSSVRVLPFYLRVDFLGI